MAEEQVSLKLLVDKKKNRVLSADAGKDFVDALLSFLTLPLGTIARIVGKDSNLKAVRVGSLSSLYESVANLDEKYFSTETCKEMLLQPRNSMESLQNPKLNIDDSEPIKYFICENWNCSREESGGLYSTFKNKRCRCGKAMNRQIGLSRRSNNHEGYVNELAAFTVSDDLKVIPNNLDSSIVVLLKNLGIEDINSVEEISVDINKNEVLDLLKCSLLSKTPLTDLFLRKKENQEDYESPYDFDIGKVSAQALAPAEDSNHMKVKVMIKKSESKILFAQAEEDFADFLLSFLTLPLGAVLNLLQGNSGSICSDNLFNSLADLHGDKHLKSEEVKNMLIKPQIASQFGVQNQILPVDEAIAPSYSCYSSSYRCDIEDRKGCLISARKYSYSNGEVYAPVTLLAPKSSSVDHTSSSGGFAKGPTMFMVTDDLVVAPFSSVSVASLLNKSNVPFHDLEERVISIGPEEGLSILKASLISSSTLTMGLLGPFIGRKMEGGDASSSGFHIYLIVDSDGVDSRMFPSAMGEEKVSLKLLVDKKKNRVLCAEAEKHLVDALLSFLTLPLGTIARIVGKDSKKAVRVGSLSSLSDSVAYLEKNFSSETCKEMLLQPRNSMESLQNPKLKIDDSDSTKFFICEDWDCSRKQSDGLYSTFKNKLCRCGRVMNREISLHESLLSGTLHGFVTELAAFTLSDDLKVTPSNLGSTIVLLQNLGFEDMDSVKKMTVNVGPKEVLDLLKCCFLSNSKTPLTDLFLTKKEIQEDFEPDDLFPFDFGNVKLQAQREDSKRMKVKVMRQQSTRKLLFAQAEEDFANLLLSFLTLPLGAVLNMLQGKSGFVCLDNLFNSLPKFHAGTHLRSDHIKNLLVKPPVAPKFKPQNHILPIQEAMASNYSCYSTKMFNSGRRRGFLIGAREYSCIDHEVYAPLTFQDPRSSSVDPSSPAGFVKGPSTYMITDDLTVTPMSSISVALFLKKCKIPLLDVEERVINIGLEEGLSILRASLVSSSALTEGLKPFL
ncbi:DUF674 family protein [Senna tora]|uniref:DUF674 family protein n=1 Tax=Senna tora TaxID=362788 RepID=A0A835CMB9_9FABA|nr:DUF674 family protein [Senna tora]